MNNIPETTIIGIGGTRRAALLAGIDMDAYPHWAIDQMAASMSVVFEAGVKHIFTPVLMDTNFNETTNGYKNRLLAWVVDGVLHLRDTMPNVRVRLLNVAPIVELMDLDRVLFDGDRPDGRPVLWVMTATDPNQYWYAIRVAHQSGHRGQQGIIRDILGEDVAPADLFIGFGKPEIMSTIVPPFLIGRMQCYWRQGLGYSITPAEMTGILDDYQNRQTWTPDKNGRNAAVHEHADLWDKSPIIGLGRRVGPFWMPV